ncbi:carbamate kinase [Nakamurella lactea]|uniref:carbamate kinase n=1 Tax=Nakamurella lactea TaxID=459515 RepID=UPI000A01E164|nr:carbamate kinase [Nakamurella lactea]
MTAAGTTGSWANRVLVALGGNAMSAPDGSATEVDQIEALGRAATHIADLVAAGVQVAVTHGNGPQVGNLLVKNELTAQVVPPVSLDWCVASTQATIGFVLADALESEFAARGIDRPVASLVTRTLVDGADPAFATPTKPVGRYLDKAAAQPFIDLGQHWRDFGDKGWRRVVASPRPLRILDAPVAATLVESGTVVICSGGGGIPVARTASAGDAPGRLTGVEAVIDKDHSAAILADLLDCDALVIATDIDNAVLHYGTPQARPLGLVGVAEMAGYLAEGHFAAGSMGPKVEAAHRFAAGQGRTGTAGRTSIITRLDLLTQALTSEPGSVGTVIRGGS